jgi:hypothetical protein
MLLTSYKDRNSPLKSLSPDKDRLSLKNLLTLQARINKPSRAGSPQALQLFVNTMRWPPWKSPKDDDDDPKARHTYISWPDSLNSTNWSHYSDPRTLIPTLLLTTTILVSVRVYSSYLRRIPEAAHIKPNFFRKRSLFGKVTRVGDADNFHLFHTPGGVMAGWGWWRKIPEKKGALKGKTVCQLFNSGLADNVD